MKKNIINERNHYLQKIRSNQTLQNELILTKEKKQRGGYRPGSGRKKGEEKVRMWIPVSKVEKVKKLLQKK